MEILASDQQESVICQDSLGVHAVIKEAEFYKIAQTAFRQRQSPARIPGRSVKLHGMVFDIGPKSYSSSIYANLG